MVYEARNGENLYLVTSQPIDMDKQKKDFNIEIWG